MDGTGNREWAMTSPSQPPGSEVIAVDLLLTGTRGLYQLVPLNLYEGEYYASTRISFEPDGRITAGQRSTYCGGFEFHQTAGSWRPGERTRVAIEVPGNGTLNLYQDGELIFSGYDSVYWCEGRPGPITGVAVWSSNEGRGTFDGIGETLTLDNIDGMIIHQPPAQVPGVPELNRSGILVLLSLIVGAGVFLIHRAHRQ